MQRYRIEIQPILDLEGCRHIQITAQQVWAAKDLDVVPIHALITLAKNGGILLGAYAPNGPDETNGMVGLVMGWPGVGHREDGTKTVKHCSHQVGVLAGWRGKGVGLRLKLAQRESVLAQGITDWVTWTYDPLQRVNAVLNIHRLGATCGTYSRNVYGEVQDALNVGLTTDRCQVDWRLRSQRVAAALSPERQDVPWALETLQVLPTQPCGDLRRPGPFEMQLDGMPPAVPLPESVDPIRQKDMGILTEWRLFMRAAFEQAFKAGYVLVDCVSLPTLGWHYIFEHENQVRGVD